MKIFKAKRLLSLVSLMLCLCIFAGVLSACQPDAPDVYNTTASVTTAPATEGTASVTTEEVLPQNPINFDELDKINKDLYAWLKIPNTVIDYPVAQSSNEDDNYYLHRDYRGNYDFAGTIYSQRHNTKYFVERVTVLYGHNMLDGSMFAGLHQFSDPEFFKENDTLYIYIPGHILTYKIFAAYDYDDRHIMNSFEFHKDDVYEQYLKDCLNPHSANAQVREGVELTTDDRIITLSTCHDYISNLRFLVQGVLVDDQRTQ
ncbi:MAG: class B sortase [Clostridia bacterium]|nr:class B sortase [Clostridia bacterium]